MKLKRRLIVVTAGLTLVTLGGAFGVVSYVVNRSQERQLDEALMREAAEEARESLATGGNRLMISDRPGPAANDTGPLTKYAVIYDVDGGVIAATPTWGGVAPPRATLPATLHRPFDLWFRNEHLRGVLVAMPSTPPHQFLLAAPRADLDGDEQFLWRAMAAVFVAAVAWSVLIASWVIGRLTKHHDAITAVTRRVADGDLSARVPSTSADDELVQLGRDVNHMIEHLASLVSAQQQFIAHAAHELRSPLTTLYGELQHALRRSRDEASYRAAISEALDGARRLKVLADDLLALARLQAGTDQPAEPVVVVEALDEAMQEVKAGAPETTIAFELATDAGTLVSGRRLDLSRLFRNLIENAARHVTTGVAVRVRLERAGNRVVVRVFNPGEPIRQSERERIFEPFVRGAHEPLEGRSGVGLGLAIARQIARAHDGHLRLGDTLDGVELIIELPLAGQAARSGTR